MNNIKLNKIIKFLGNPNIFVFGIAWMIVLVVIGTIAQRDIGLYQAQQIFFSSWIGWFGYLPYPSGRLLMFIISFNLNGVHFNDLAMLLDKKNIAIRTGHHCAQPFMKHFNISGNARMSVGIYNTKNEIDYFIKSLDDVKMILKS